MKNVSDHTTGNTGPVISLMLAVSDTPEAVEWYKRALGATVLWSLGPVAGLEIAGAAFFLGEPARNGWEAPAKLGITSARVEVFCDDPDAFIARAVAAGAKGDHDKIRDHEAPWGKHRQGGFVDPFGHIWLVGDRSPLKAFPNQ
jgi:PhnB protein